MLHSCLLVILWAFNIFNSFDISDNSPHIFGVIWFVNAAQREYFGMSKVSQLKINFHFPFHYISRIFRSSQKTVFRVSGKFFTKFQHIDISSILNDPKTLLSEVNSWFGGSWYFRRRKNQIEEKKKSWGSALGLYCLYCLYCWVCTASIHSFTPGVKRWKISVLLSKESHHPSFLSFDVLWDAAVSLEKGWKS